MITPSTSKAKSLLAAAEREKRFLNKIQLDADSAPTVIRNTYEAFRMLGEARLALAGIKSADHDTQIQEVLRLKVVAERPLATITSLKRLRNDVNYRGYAPTIAEAQDALDFLQKTFPACVKAVGDEILT